MIIPILVRSPRAALLCAWLCAGCNLGEEFVVNQKDSGANERDAGEVGVDEGGDVAEASEDADAMNSCAYLGRGEGVCASGRPTPDESSRCEAPEDYSLEEIAACDGLDNDCDGTVDEGCACAFGAERGACAVGRIEEGGSCARPPFYEETEVSCDGYDNDCDGQIDQECETCWFDEASAEGIAAIEPRGSCLFGRPIAAGGCARPASYMHTEDECRQDPSAGDGVDNDCDGIIDEGCACAFLGTRRGVCAAGRLAGGGACTEPYFYEVTEVACDGRDNDCDGEVDESCARRSLPPSLDPPGLITKLSAGVAHACALLKGGELWCWGSTASARRGAGFEGEYPLPTPVAGLPPVDDVGLGWFFSCARDIMNGFTYCWGAMHAGAPWLSDQERAALLWTDPRRLDDVYNLEGYAGGFYHMCAVQQGSVLCWGSDDGEQLGNPEARAHSYERPLRVGGLDGVSEIAAGRSASCAVTQGEVWCWGLDRSGELGDGPSSADRSPTPVRVLGIEDASQIALGNDFACALRAEGKVSCWGTNGRGQLGIGAAIESLDAPGPVVLLSEKATAVSARDKFACALLESGSIECWGGNDTGALGDNSKPLRSARTPVEVRSIGDATQIAVGGSFACALRTSGRVSCWGSHHQGQMGDGLPIADTARAASPVFVEWPRE